MNARRRQLITVLLVVAAVVIGVSWLQGCKKSEPEETGTTEHEHEHAMVTESAEQVVAGAEQTICPVMGGAINKSIYTEYKGKKVYFCCAACIEKFKADPEKYIAKLPQFKD